MSEPRFPGGRAPARVLIAGCGDVGTELGRRLAAGGHAVWGLRRRPQGLPPPIRPLAADLADPATLAALPACDYVVYTAAADRHDEEAYRRAYVDGPGRLLAALREQGTAPRRFFFTSSTGVYGQDRGEWVDETSPAEPASFSGRILLEGEGRLRASGIPATIVRLAGIYGPGRTRLVDEVRSGRAARAAAAGYTNRIHRDDCAGFLAHLVEMDLAGEPVAEVYVGVDDEPAERREVVRWLAARLGVPEPAAEAPPSSGLNKRCRNARLKATGYCLRFPTYREGYAAILDDLGSRPS